MTSDDDLIRADQQPVARGRRRPDAAEHCQVVTRADHDLRGQFTTHDGEPLQQRFLADRLAHVVAP